MTSSVGARLVGVLAAAVMACAMLAPVAWASDSIGWTRMAVPAPAGGGWLNRIDCRGTGWCMAVEVRGDDQPLAMQYSDGAWSVVPHSVLNSSMGGYNQLSLYTVSCSSPTSCLVIGNYGLGVAVDVLLAWDGVSFRPLDVPRSWSIGDVTCLTEAYCLVTGYVSRDSIHSHTLAAVWNGTTFGRMKTPTDSRGADLRIGQVDALGSVTCVKVDHCAAISTYGIETLNGGRAWRLRRLSGPGQGYAFMYGIHCFTVRRCMASGGDESSTGARYWTGSLAGRWIGHHIPPRRGALRSKLTCGTARSCLAIGTMDGYADRLFDVPQYLDHWRKGLGWSRSKTPGTTRDQWADAWCGAQHCMLVGARTLSSSRLTPIAAFR